MVFVWRRVRHRRNRRGGGNICRSEDGGYPRPRPKQHLKIKTFYGYSENAVRTQLWRAVSVYCLLAIIREEVGAGREMGAAMPG